MVPFTGRASSFCMYINQFTQSYNILHRLQVHHLTITLSYKYINTIFIYIYGIILQSSSSFFFRLHGQPEVFANLMCLLAINFSSLSFLYNSFSAPHFNLLRVARRCFWWSSVSDDLLFSSCTFLFLYYFRSYPQPFFPLFFSL